MWMDGWFGWIFGGLADGDHIPCHIPLKFWDNIKYITLNPQIANWKLV